MTPTKGCLLVNEDVNLTGGAEKMIRQTACSLNNIGLNVGLASCKEVKDSTGLNEFLLPFFNKNNNDNLQEYVDKTLRIMKRNSYDILHVFNVSNYDLIIELSKKIKVLKTVSDTRIYCPSEFKIKHDGSICTNKVDKRCYKCLNKYESNKVIRKQKMKSTQKGLLSLNNVACIITPSKHTRNQLIENGVSPKKAITVHPYLDKVKPQIKNEMDNDPNLKSDLLFVGRLIKSKGVKHAISVASLLDNQYKLNIVGEQPSYARDKDLINEKRLSENVNLVGWIDNMRIDYYYHNTKVCLVPSLSPEAFGLIGLEAMRNKKPVVAYDSGGISEWLDNGQNGFIVERGDIKAMADKTKFLLEHPKIAKEMGEKGFEILKTNFTKSNHITQVIKCYEQYA